ncbi:MAG TPA: serine/threonine-protein kinase [Burkholderiales bacterium]|nr:serine/threonine-protein kinase [Burkholderiales bacterium]
MQTHIGKYLLKKKLGAGASGSVYLALDEFSGREVALKFYEIGKSPETSEFARSQFLTEASLAGRLWHPHIALIMDACSDDTISYVVTEFVPGGSLSQFTGPRGLLSFQEVVEIGFKCSGALDYAFRNDVIHRDIKPANILRSVDSQVKISDFGVAFIRNAMHTQILDAGSPYYASPEQATGAELSHQSDMFSLGVVLYEMLAGRRPFVGESNGQVLHRLVTVDPEPLSGVRPDIPAALGDIVMRALQKAPRDRYSNWAEFALDLAKAGKLSKYDKSIPDSEKFTALKTRPMLSELDDGEIWEFVNAGKWSRLPSYTAVVREGETGDSLFLLAEGEAKVTLQGRLLNVLATGEWFGEQPYISGEAVQRQATVETTVDSVLVEYSLAALDGLSDRCQKRFAKALLRTLADRLALSNVRISRMT